MDSPRPVIAAQRRKRGRSGKEVLWGESGDRKEKRGGVKIFVSTPKKGRGGEGCSGNLFNQGSMMVDSTFLYVAGSIYRLYRE